MTTNMKKKKYYLGNEEIFLEDIPILGNLLEAINPKMNMGKMNIKKGNK